MAPRIFLNIVAWNSMEFLPDLLKSIAAQTCQDFQVLVIDNGSTDGVEAYLRAHHPNILVLRNAKNLGFSPAHNQGIRYALSAFRPEDHVDRFVLIVNPDVLLTPTFVERLLADAEAHPEAGSFGGKLLRAYLEHGIEEGEGPVRSDRLDSTGLQAHRNRTFTDRGAGELDRGHYDEAREVFGISGAVAMYRASALQEARFEDEFFDKDFFAYKEDVDLAWRLQWLGWKARFTPEAVAYHYRGMYGREGAGWIELIRNRQRKSLRRSFYSTRNHWNVLMKNEGVWSGLLALPWILPMEIARVLYVCVFEPRNIGAFFEAIGRAPRMWQKRRDLFRRRKVRGHEIRKWFV